MSTQIKRDGRSFAKIQANGGEEDRCRRVQGGILGHNCRVPRAHLMGTVLDMDARGELINKIIHTKETRLGTLPRSCKENSTLNRKCESEKVKAKLLNKDKSNNLGKNMILPKTRGGKRH